MKLIIDIPKVDYNYAKQQVADGITNPLKIFIASGIPLDKIRAEILNFKEKCNASDYLGCGILDVIDKYR